MKRWVLLGALMSLGGGCKDTPGHAGACPPEPDFTVTVETIDVSQALPVGTTIRVDYGGTLTESYELGSSADSHEVLFCTGTEQAPTGEGGARGDGSENGGAGTPSGAFRLTCQVWTSGPARVSVSAPGYLSVTHDLKAQPAQCTLSDTIQLAPEVQELD